MSDLVTTLSFETELYAVPLEENAIKAAIAPMFAENVHLVITTTDNPQCFIPGISELKSAWQSVPTGYLKVRGIARRPPTQRFTVGWSDGAIHEALNELVACRDENEYPPLTHSQALAVAIDCLRAVLGQEAS